MWQKILLMKRWLRAQASPLKRVWSQTRVAAAIRDLRFRLKYGRAARGAINAIVLSPERHFRRHFWRESSHVVFDLEKTLANEAVKGLGLIFFMGMGDYFYATPLLSEIRRRFPNTPIHAYVGDRSDINNAPLVATLLAQNKNVDEVRTYRGHWRGFFKNYDYHDALTKIPEGFVAVPLLYEHLPRVRHRQTTLFQTFGFAPPPLISAPIVDFKDGFASHVKDLASEVLERVARAGLKGVVFLQLDARSTGYSYPRAQDLAERLCRLGYFVVSASKLQNRAENSSVGAPRSLAENFPEHFTENSIELDFSRFSIKDSTDLLKLLHEASAPLSLLTVVSVFWSISAGLGIRNLGMHHFVDPAVHAVWYPNIFVVSHVDYEKIPKSRLVLAGQKDFQLNSMGLADFDVDFVVDSFQRMQQAEL